MALWYEQDCPQFQWALEPLSLHLSKIYLAQGILQGSMLQNNAATRQQAWLKTLSLEVQQSNAMEAIALESNDLQAALTTTLNLGEPKQTPTSAAQRWAALMADLTQHYQAPLSAARLCRWHELMGECGTWRESPQSIDAGASGRDRIYVEAPPAEAVAGKIQSFLTWLNQEGTEDGVIKAGIAYVWFIMMQPFEKGNALMARAITQHLLARAQQSSEIFYSFSAQMAIEQSTYDYVLGTTLRGGLNIQAWLDWFMGCATRAIAGADIHLSAIKGKVQFWDQLASLALNNRQRKMLEQMLNGLKGNLTTSKWADLMACSQDTAYRDILDLIDKGVLRKSKSSGRSSHYKLVLRRERS